MVRMSRFLCAFGFSTLYATAATNVPNIAQAIWLDDYPEAKCLDGSSALYYIRPATSTVNATKWVFHIQGGGWCNSMDNCQSRSKGRLGSSTPSKSGDNATMDLVNIQGCENNRWCGALMMNDAEVNPYSHDWNAVLLRYCDGASFIGNADQPVSFSSSDGNDESLYFRGWRNLEATMTDLLAKHSLGQATEVLIGGDSAGGLATFLHVDYMVSRIHDAGSKALAVAMPDSGFWPDSEGFAKTFRSMLAMQNGTAGLMPSCVEANAGNISRCLFPQYFAQSIRTTLFPLQSLFDPLQVNGSPEGSPQAHGMWLLEQMQHLVLSKPRNGGWIHSCKRHCGASLLTINGTRGVPQAIQAFLRGEQRLWLQNETYPCSSCCNDGDESFLV